MNIEYLKEFTVFAHSMNYTSAAKELYISQPTLSQHITALEKELGLSLVNHASSPQLTQVGSLLSVRASELCDLYNEIVEECKAVSCQVNSQIRIMEFRQLTTIPPSSVAKALSESGKQNVTIRYIFPGTIRNVSPVELVKTNDEVDVAVELFPYDATEKQISDQLGPMISFFVLPPQDCMAVISRSHPLAYKETLNLADISDFKCILLGSELTSRHYQTVKHVLTRIVPDVHFACFPQGIKDYGPMMSGKFVNIVTPGQAKWLEEDSGGSVVGKRIEGLDLQEKPVLLWRLDNPNLAVCSFMQAWKKILSQNLD